MAYTASMAEALRLTRAGNLKEATALLQGMLGTAAPPVPTPASGPVIDIVPNRVTLDPAPRPATTTRGAAGTFTDESWSGPAGTIGYRLYRPAGAAAGMPLVVMLHGCTQSPEDFAAGTAMNALADELGFIVAYPRQTPRANQQKCWNWFRPGDQQRDRGEPALIAGVTRQVIADHAIDPARVYVAGLSAGGAAAAIMAARYPDLFAAAGIHSGLACGAARNLPGALTAMKQGGQGDAGERLSFVPVITFHGDRDTTVDAVNAREIVASARAASTVMLVDRTERGKRAGGRGYTRLLVTDPAGRAVIEQWTIDGAGHAWSGGSAAGSHTDPSGPDASREMLRFFLANSRA